MPLKMASLACFAVGTLAMVRPSAAQLGAPTCNFLDFSALFVGLQLDQLCRHGSRMLRTPPLLLAPAPSALQLGTNRLNQP